MKTEFKINKYITILLYPMEPAGWTFNISLKSKHSGSLILNTEIFSSSEEALWGACLSLDDKTKDDELEREEIEKQAEKNDRAYYEKLKARFEK